MGSVSLGLNVSQGAINNLIEAALIEKGLDQKLLRIALKDERIALSLALRKIVSISPWENIQLAFMINSFNVKDKTLELQLKSNFKSLNLLMKLIFPIIKNHIRKIDYSIKKDMLFLSFRLPDDVPKFSNLSFRLMERSISINSEIFLDIEYIRSFLKDKI